MFDCGHISIWIACFYSRNEGYIIFILNIRSWRHVVLLGAVFCCLNLQLLQFTGHCRETSFPQESPPNPKYFVSETYFWVIQAREYSISSCFLFLSFSYFVSRHDQMSATPALRAGCRTPQQRPPVQCQDGMCLFRTVEFRRTLFRQVSD